MTTLDLVKYYANLLILQYRQKPKAYATVQATSTPIVLPQVSTQSVALSAPPISGAFVLSYLGNSTAAINWNDSVMTIQSKLQALSGLSAVTVTGSLASSSLVVIFTGAPAPAELLVLVSNSLVDVDSNPVSIEIDETDVTLPIAVQNAFNLLGADIAQGVQLNIIGKYAGVSRSGYGFEGQPITLDDSDFLSLIQFAVITNSAGSSLAQIQALLFQFFPFKIFVFDYADMHMSYMIDASVGTPDFAQMIVVQGLLPKPMGVQLATIIYALDIVDFFGFRTYSLPGFNNTPFNSYTDYETNRPWLSYADALM